MKLLCASGILYFWLNHVFFSNQIYRHFLLLKKNPKKFTSIFHVKKMPVIFYSVIDGK